MQHDVLLQYRSSSRTAIRRYIGVNRLAVRCWDVSQQFGDSSGQQCWTNVADWRLDDGQWNRDSFIQLHIHVLLQRPRSERTISNRCTEQCLVDVHQWTCQNVVYVCVIIIKTKLASFRVTTVFACPLSTFWNAWTIGLLQQCSCPKHTFASFST